MATEGRQDIEQAEHTDDDPSIWGWHHEFGKGAHAAGWISAIILVLMMTSTHYNLQGTLFLGISAGIIVVMLIWDMQRRRNAWRK